MDALHTRCNQKTLRLCLFRKNWLRHWLCECERVIELIFVSQGSLIFLSPRAGAHICCETGSVSESASRASRSINRPQNEPKSVSQIIDFSWLFCFALTTKQVVFAGVEPKVPKHEVHNKERALHCFLQHSVCALWIHPQCKTVNDICSNVLRKKIQPTQTLARWQLGGSWWQCTGSLATLTHPLPTLWIVLLRTSRSLQAVYLDHPCSQNELHIKTAVIWKLWMRCSLS